MDFSANLRLALLALIIEAGVGYPAPLFRAIGHPVTWAGRLIAFTDEKLNRSLYPFAARRAAGFAALALLFLIGWASASSLCAGLAALPLWLNLGLSAIAASTLIAQRSLYAHVFAVAKALELGLAEGRTAAARIVGRDISILDESGIARAAIESLAENFSDAVAAPAFWIVLGGLPGGIWYKALNTADSMIGHRTKRHAAFGYAAARLDDFANLLPARHSALLIMLAALVTPGASAAAAWRTIASDASGHPSPNAGFPEAAMAGALGVKLGGPRTYGEILVDDQWIGSGKETSATDIARALALYKRACVVHWLVLLLAAASISLC